MEPEELIKKVESDEIHWNDASQSLIKMSTQPWHSKIWKENRDRIIKNYCEQCDDRKGPFVIQHFSHSLSLEAIFKNLVKTEFDDYLEKENIHIPPIIIPNRKMCPKCSSLSIRERKTMKPKFCCIKCEHKFETARIGDYVKSERDYSIYSEYKIDFEYKNSERIRKEAIIIAIKHFIEYISLKNTQTYCKKCAFLLDKKGLILCSECKKNYHSFFYDQCYECYSGEKWDSNKNHLSDIGVINRMLQDDEDFTFI